MAITISAPTTTLQPTDVHWIGVRFLDPLGRVFEFEGEYYRAIYPHQVGYVRQLLDSGLLQRLSDRGLLVETRISDKLMEGYGLVLKHQTIPFITYADVWCRRFYRDAAIAGIDLNLELLKDGLGTIDFHTNNTLQGPNCLPLWIDLGSISPLNAFDGGASLLEMRNHFLHPLFLMSQREHLTQIARFITYRLGGISPEQFRDMTGATIEMDLHDRRKALLDAREWLEKLSFPTISTTWDAYQQESYAHDIEPARIRESGDKRAEVIYRILNHFKPRKFVDLSCNAGKFSFLAASMGADAYGVDLDDEAVDRMYQYAREFPKPLSLTAAVHDVMQPPRAVGNFTLALALTHHLSISQRHRFESIAERFASYTTDVLLTEFMPYGLGSTVPTPDPLPSGYTLREFVNAHRSYFSKLEIIYCPAPETQSFRVLLLCTGKGSGRGEHSQMTASLMPRDTKTAHYVYRIVCEHCSRIFSSVENRKHRCSHCGTATEYPEFSI